MGNVHHGIPKEIVIDLQKRYGLDTLIETGTFKGATAEWASAHFAHVTTVELSPTLHSEAVARLGARSNIRFILGDSREALPIILEELEKSALFWLDGHWTMPQGAAGEAAQCPILEELDALNRSRLDHVILIDDARLFARALPPHRAADWPTMAQVVAKLSEGGRRRCVRIFDDVIFAAPESSQKIFEECFFGRKSGVWKARFRRAFRPDGPRSAFRQIVPLSVRRVAGRLLRR